MPNDPFLIGNAMTGRYGAAIDCMPMNTLARLNTVRGDTRCVIELDRDFIGRLCDPVIVMAKGRVMAQGSAADFMQKEAVIEAYLGAGLKNKGAAIA